MHIKKNSEKVYYAVYILVVFSQIRFSIIWIQNVSSEHYSIKQLHAVTPLWPSSTPNFRVTETSFLWGKKHSLRFSLGSRRTYNSWLLQNKGFCLLQPGTTCGSKPHTALQPLQQEKMHLKMLQYQTHECAELLKFTSWKIQYTLGRKYDWFPLSRLFIRQTHFANFDINC